MAWIESHQTLARHPKAIKAAHLLGIGRAQVIGHLHLLWWWALDYAQDGDVSAFGAVELAEAAAWEGNAEAFVTALLDCGPGGRPGFLERTADGRLVIHDWWEYAGKLIARRTLDAARKRADRARTSDGRPAAAPPDGQGTSPARPADAATDVQRTSSGRPADVSRTVPNPTVPNQPNPTDQPRDASRAPNGRAAVASGGRPAGRRKPEEIATWEPLAFARLWNFFGKLGGCEDAAREWDRLQPDRELMRAMRLAIEQQREAFGWGQPGGQAQPYLSTWLHQRRWTWEAVPNKVE
jgi:hypothetical protein